MMKEELTIRGDVAAPDFPEWIVHRARRLGLKGGIIEVGDKAIKLFVAGPLELVDAMEVGCSLGPTSVQVEAVERSIIDFDVIDCPFDYISDS